MKILIACYSKSGNTQKVAEAIKQELEANNHFVDVEKIKPAKEHNFFVWFFLRVFRGRCNIEELNIKNVSEYDAVLVGSPNWTRLSLPVEKYLKTVTGLENKKIGLFSTTAIPPRIEWYIFSAYFLDMTFAKIAEAKGCRIIDSILLSSVFKKYDFSSSYGKKIIKNFCAMVQSPIFSFQEYAMKQKEINGNRLVIVALLIVYFLLLFLQIIIPFLGGKFFTWDQFLVFSCIGFITYILMLTIMERRKGINFGKYIAALAMILAWTLVVNFLAPGYGQVIILGYVFLITSNLSFRNIRVIFFAGACSILSYFYLVFFAKGISSFLVPIVDIPIIFSGIIVAGFITNSFQQHFLDPFKAQDDIEEARLTLEIKIAARTRELRELADSLEDKIEERTIELEGKIKELERFNSLAVGRELKMVELKREIKFLEEELKKVKAKKK